MKLLNKKKIRKYRIGRTRLAVKEQLNFGALQLLLLAGVCIYPDCPVVSTHKKSPKRTRVTNIGSVLICR